MTFNKTKNVLITGGSSDLALGLARKCIDNLILPTLTYRNNNRLKKIQRMLTGNKFKTICIDFGEPFYPILLNSFNTIDALVDLAQSNFEAYIASANDSDINTYIQTNITNKALLLKYVSRIMLKEKNGRLIYVSSTAAASSNPGQGFYGASKRACEGLFISAGLELASKGITSVVVRPGYIESGRSLEYLNKYPEVINRRIPVKRLLSNEELAENLLFFLSDDAQYINGTTVTIDGGLTAVK